jgi:RNA polymerase subunit RPABC4/transcription elongation factor Spt4
MKIWRLVSGILSMVLFLVITFQSCAVGLVNVVEDNKDDTSGAGGILVAFGLLVAGIVATALWKNKSKAGDIALIVLYGLTALIGFANLGTFGDLVVWSSWALICTVMAAIALVINFRANRNVEVQYAAPQATNFVGVVAKKVCPYCHSEADADSTFCGSCGQKLPIQSFCKNCGNPLEADAAFCPNCGTKQKNTIEPTHQVNTVNVEQSRLPYDIPEQHNDVTIVADSQDENIIPQPNKDERSILKWMIMGLVIFLIVAGAAVGVFIYLKNSSSNLNNSDETIMLTNKKTYIMRGTVLNYPITMHLEFNDSQVNGYYYYNRQFEKIGSKAYLNLIGTFENGYIDLNETNSDGTPTGHFQGWLKNNTFKGDFINTKGERMPFDVSQ